VGKKKKKTNSGSTIALNKKAKFDYRLEERLEAGIVLEGWEVKSMRAGRVQIKESYVIIRNGELYLFGAHISPLISASTHINPDPTRLRKLLLNSKEISHLIGSVDRKGYTLVPVALYWKRGRAKLEVALAKGKQQHDKRASIKEREWKRDKERLMKHGR
jgi:SsrA-binding protein